MDGELNIKVTPIETNTNINADIQINPANLVLDHFRRRAGEFVALMLVGMLALWLLRGTLMNAVAEVKSNAGMDTIWGLVVYLLYIPVVFVLFLLLV